LFNNQLLVFSSGYQPLLDNLDDVILWLIYCFCFVELRLASACPSPPSSAPELVLLLLDLLLNTCPSPPGLGLELQSITIIFAGGFPVCVMLCKILCCS
jgi:hypothetical protein